MAVEDRPVRPDHHDRVEQRRAAELTINLMNAAHDRHAEPRRALGNRRQTAAVEVDRLLAQARVDFSGERHVAAGLEPPHPGRIAGHIGLGEHDQAHAGRGDLVHPTEHALDRGGPVEQHRRRLHHGDFHGHGNPQRIVSSE